MTVDLRGAAYAASRISSTLKGVGAPSPTPIPGEACVCEIDPSFGVGDGFFDAAGFSQNNFASEPRRSDDSQLARPLASPLFALLRRISVSQSTSRPASDNPKPDADARDCTSQQHNTHRIEWREVRYAWHPWYGRAVAVSKRFARYGRPAFQCSIEADPKVRLLEIPEWMFDPAICLRMRVAAMPTVSCEALLDLRSLLECAPVPNTGVVLQAQHRSLLSPGGADAKVAEPQDPSIHTVSATTEGSSLAGAASRNQTECGGASRATAARALRKPPRLRQQKGGGQ
jgi:hypothetical protein